MTLEATLLFFAFVSISLVLGLVALAVILRLIRLRSECEKAWSHLEVLLKQRADLLPDVAVRCERHFPEERPLIEKIVQARNAWISALNQGISGRIEASGAVQEALRPLVSGAGEHSSLRGVPEFTELRRVVGTLESRIAERRAAYNACAGRFNARISGFPDLLAARLLDYREIPLFEISTQLGPTGNADGPA